MTIALTCTWNPRGELPYLKSLLPQLKATYATVVIAIRSSKFEAVKSLNQHPGLTLFEMPAPGWGRYLGLKQALEAKPDHIHYADLDTVLYWVDHHPDEWLQTLARLYQTDCLVMGRSQRAFETRPQAIQQTEFIINRIFSHIFGQEMDFGLGMRGYSRQAAERIIQVSQPGRWGDTEWPMLIQQAGMKVDFCTVDGVDWLSSGHSFAEETTPVDRQQMALEYDHRAKSWMRRVQIANEIIQQGLEGVGHKTS